MKEKGDSGPTPVMAFLTAQLRSSIGRRKIRASNLKSLGESGFIQNKRMHIDPQTPQKFRSPNVQCSLNYVTLKNKKMSLP